MSTARSSLAIAAGALSLAACAAHTLEVRGVEHGLDAKKRSAFDQAYEGGKAQLTSNHVGLALVLFEKALAIDPNSVAALNAVGTAYDELHFPNMAQRYYARALALEPNSADTLNNMALSARIAGKPDEARALFERALAADAANRTIRANLGAIEAPVQTAAAATSEDAPADAPVVERVGQNAFKIVLPPPAPTQAHSISVEPLPPPLVPAYADASPPEQPTPAAIAAPPYLRGISVEPLATPAIAPTLAEAGPHEQSMRAQIAAFFAERDQRRNLAAAESTIAKATFHAASEASSAPSRSYAERTWFGLFRAFFEQREAKEPRVDRKDASAAGARNG